MTSLIKKLNFKDHQSIGIFNAPEEFTPHLEDFSRLAPVHTDTASVRQIDFAIVFVQTEGEIKEWSRKIAPLLSNDAPFWFAYPKKSSKKYKASIHRDSGWDTLGQLGFEGVRMVAIDDDWSALRFRKAENIKTLRRKSLHALSEDGKKRTQQ